MEFMEGSASRVDGPRCPPIPHAFRSLSHACQHSKRRGYARTYTLCKTYTCCYLLRLVHGSGNTLAGRMADDLLTSAEVARMLRVSPATVARYVRLGQVRAIRLPSGQIRIRREEVERLLREEGPDR